LLYIAISSAAIAFLIASSVLGYSFEFIAVTVGTAFIFGSLVVTSWRVRSRTFWIFTALCLLFHIAVVIPAAYVLLRQETHGKAWLIGGGSFLEYGILVFLRDLVLRK